MPYKLSTFSGESIDFMDPKPNQIHLNDIAHALGHTCRFSAQIPYYSVAEHCIIGGDRLSTYSTPRNMALHFYLHDAPEAYLLDMPTPLRKLLKESTSVYEDLHTNFLKVIYESLDLDLPEYNETDILHKMDVKMRDSESFKFRIKIDREIEPDPKLVSRIIGYPPEIASGIWYRRTLAALRNFKGFSGEIINKLSEGDRYE